MPGILGGISNRQGNTMISISDSIIRAACPWSTKPIEANHVCLGFILFFRGVSVGGQRYDMPSVKTAPDGALDTMNNLPPRPVIQRRAKEMVDECERLCVLMPYEPGEWPDPNGFWLWYETARRKIGAPVAVAFKDPIRSNLASM